MNIIPADSHALCVSLFHSISYTVLFLNPFCFNLPLTVDELSNVVKSFSADKAPGHDNKAMKIIHHQSLQNIVQPLVSIINPFRCLLVCFPNLSKWLKNLWFLRQNIQHFLETTGQYQFFHL